jgi:hypothetical protein
MEQESKTDGGPAFPVTEFDHQIFKPKHESEVLRLLSGMSLRDYMAVHSTQPGIAEICKVAGFGWDGVRVYLQKDAETGIRFDEWWRTLTLERMCDLSARVRYAQADAMLKARQS